MSEYAVVFDQVTKHYRPLRDGLRRRDPTAGVTAVDRVSFTVDEGEALAIIGANGAGKTTCLRMIARLTAPTSGRMQVRGRVAALIAVGSGLHMELTGRENVELYAKILGLHAPGFRRRESQILEFAELGDALDRPVKTYSSGMALRLGFSVSVHVEPEVLLVDEAIVVGDATFQKRCTDRMRELRDSGCSLILVSHELGLVQNLCEHAIRLHEGAKVDEGTPPEVVDRYLRSDHAGIGLVEPPLPLRGLGVDLEGVDVCDAQGRAGANLVPGQPWTVRFHFSADRPEPAPKTTIGLFHERHGIFMLVTMLTDGGEPGEISGRQTVECRFDDLPIRPGEYWIWTSVHDDAAAGHLFPWQPVRRFTVGDADRDEEMRQAYVSPLNIAHTWSTDQA